MVGGRVAPIALKDGSIPPILRNKIRQLAQQKATGVSLRDLYMYGADPSPVRRVLNSKFLHRELPIRIAQRVEELHALPHGLSEKKPVIDIRNMYASYVNALLEYPRPDTTPDEEGFTALLGRLLQRHSTVVHSMSLGVLETRVALGDHYDESVSREIDHALNRFYLARIGLRFLISHHLEAKKGKPGFQGIIQADCSPLKVAKEAVEDAQSVCNRTLGMAPEVSYHGHKDYTLTYVPSHLHYMLYEVLKNSMRATVETHRDSDKPLPRLRLVFAKGDEDVTIKICDEGGGIPRSDMRTMWTYHHTTATTPKELLAILREEQSHQGGALAGYGVGLPLSRLYAQYFGGDLVLMSMEGFGTDAYIHLNRLGKKCENLPQPVAQSPGERDSNLPELSHFDPFTLPPF